MTNILATSSVTTVDKSQGPFVAFENLYDLLDGMMLFGAALSKSDREGQRIRVELGRSRRHWATLYLGVALLEMHGIPMNLLSGEKSLMSKQGKLVYKSQGYATLRPAFAKWYGGQAFATTPDQLELSDELIAIWMIGHLGKMNRDRLRLTSPVLTRTNAEGLLDQIQDRAFEAAVVRAGRHYAIQLSKEGTQAACNWLEHNYRIDASML